MTSPISGSSVSFHSPEEIDGPPQQPAVVPPPPPPTEANGVGAWSGSKSGSAPAHDTSSSGLTAGQLAHGPLPTLTSDFVTPGIDALMGQTFVSVDDARDAVSMLEQLSPKEYRKALESMGGRTMKTMFGTMDESTKAAFFAQARQKGAITEEPGVRMPPRVGSPPDKPALLRNESSLRPELRDAIHGENKARARDYMQQFNRYTDRYAEAALAAPSPMVLRSMGPPVGEFALFEPGLIGRDNARYGTLDQGTATSRARAARAVNDRISDFAGRTRAGSLSLVGAARVTVEAEHAGLELELKREEELSDSGKRQTKLGGEVLAIAPGVSAGVDDQGNTVQRLKAGDFKAKFENGEAVQVEGKAAGLGVKREEGKTTLSATVPGAPIGAYAAIDEKKGSFGGGFKASREAELHGLGKIDVEVKLGFEAQGIAPERLGDIASMKDRGIWGPLPELSGSGTKWSQIPADRQAELQRQCGFNRSNWPVK